VPTPEKLIINRETETDLGKINGKIFQCQINIQ